MILLQLYMVNWRVYRTLIRLQLYTAMMVWRIDSIAMVNRQEEENKPILILSKQTERHSYIYAFGYISKQTPSVNSSVSSVIQIYQHQDVLWFRGFFSECNFTYLYFFHSSVSVLKLYIVFKKGGGVVMGELPKQNSGGSCHEGNCPGGIVRTPK